MASDTARAEKSVQAETSENSFSGRITIEHTQGFRLLSGGYIDQFSFYADLWDAGRSYGLAVGFLPLPLLRLNLGAEISSHPDAGAGIDQLDTGVIQGALSLSLPLSLDPGQWLAAKEIPRIRGVVVNLTARGGIRVVDPIWDAFGRRFERTFTYSIGIDLELEYRLAGLGLFIRGGFFVSGPLVGVPAYSFHPDVMLLFPIDVGVRVYI